jgi:hypothetical protein
MDGPSDPTAALAAAAAAGPYFALERAAGGPPWQPLSALITDPAVLAERVDHARRALARGAGCSPGEIPERAAASIMFLGLAARLVSPSLGAAVAGGVVPDLAIADLWWRPAPGGPLPLAAGRPGGAAVGALASAGEIADAARRLSKGCVQGLAGPAAEAFGSVFRLSRRVLWGNVASALAGAAGMLAAAFPARADAAGRLTGELLGLGALRGTGDLVQPDPSRPARFLVRRSCCLFYRVPGGGLCGDCVLVPDEVRHQQWQSALSR